MDIAKYIGLFLLKNQYCYIHGIGNMELIKRPATYDGKALQSPSYEVIVTQGGSIDDNLANFIATNEQISISKAANELREYSMAARREMAGGKEVPVSEIGRFYEDKGKVKFITNDNFRYVPAGVPTIKNSKQLEEQNARPAHKPSYPPPHKADSINWSMVILAVVLLIIVGGGIYGIYYYTQKNRTEQAEEAQPVKDTVAQVAKPAVADTTQAKHDSTAVAQAAPVDTMQISPYRMVIGDYATRAKADKREHNLTLNGNHVEIVAKDSANFLIVTTVNCNAKDTVRVIDSLHRLFGYKDVTVLK